MNPPIFSGPESKTMWESIRSADSVDKLRGILYLICCRIQELEAVMRENISDQENPPTDAQDVV